ncbi:hypothetical protein HNR44_002837 [Geomicrobium halophilum]|uniref:NETI protein n=1 Tax=Geomicrobium halophilum TaxID=549000 RepID=A0A841PPV1_9BACL|nr:NETI motif-containing protein [Geomicrobium halophilum]MBB6450847.1 hypothetical protein [Geomicrobium halophilum]
MGKKIKYEVANNESIADCLERIERDGYQPVRRLEKPVFKEGDSDVEFVGQRIEFEVKKK